MSKKTKPIAVPSPDGKDELPTASEIDHVKPEEHIKKFKNMLADIDGLDDKKKALWLQIYTNAVTDRYHAYDMYTDLVILSRGNATNHAIHSTNMVKYIERMSRATDQLIKLAELIAEAQKKSDGMDADDIYRKLSSA